MAIPREIFVPATISGTHTYESGDIRKVELTLPTEFEIEGRVYPIVDFMRPGTAFLAKPFGARTGKRRRRMYTRSNCANECPRVLETVINDTHREKADTSPWWQSEDIERMKASGATIDVRVDFDPGHEEMRIFENSNTIERSNLRLESEDLWPNWQMLGMAFSTGITPFLSYLRYMNTMNFGRSGESSGVRFILIVSVRNFRQLIDHQELLDLAESHPKNFQYFPVLTREWPDNWPYTKGRIIRVVTRNGREEVDLRPLAGLVPDVQNYHVRMCGSRQAHEQLELGLCQIGHVPLSFRFEVW